jgi:hypothetical protein
MLSSTKPDLLLRICFLDYSNQFSAHSTPSNRLFLSGILKLTGKIFTLAKHCKKHNKYFNLKRLSSRFTVFLIMKLNRNSCRHMITHKRPYGLLRHRAYIYAICKKASELKEMIRIPEVQ